MESKSPRLEKAEDTAFVVLAVARRLMMLPQRKWFHSILSAVFITGGAWVFAHNIPYFFYMNLAKVALEYGNFDVAEELYKIALSESYKFHHPDGRVIKVESELGQLYLDECRFDESAKTFAHVRLLQLQTHAHPKDQFETLLRLGIAYRKEAQSDLALKTLTSAFEICERKKLGSHDTAQVQLALAEFYLANNSYAKAAASATNAPQYLANSSDAKPAASATNAPQDLASNSYAKPAASATDVPQYLASNSHAKVAASPANAPQYLANSSYAKAASLAEEAVRNFKREGSRSARLSQACLVTEIEALSHFASPVEIAKVQAELSALKIPPAHYSWMEFEQFGYKVTQHLLTSSRDDLVRPPLRLSRMLTRRATTDLQKYLNVLAPSSTVPPTSVNVEYVRMSTDTSKGYVPMSVMAERVDPATGRMRRFFLRYEIGFGRVSNEPILVSFAMLLDHRRTEPAQKSAVGVQSQRKQNDGPNVPQDHH